MPTETRVIDQWTTLPNGTSHRTYRLIKCIGSCSTWYSLEIKLTNTLNEEYWHTLEFEKIPAWTMLDRLVEHLEAQSQATEKTAADE